jgi:hypothetical protein
MYMCMKIGKPNKYILYKSCFVLFIYFCIEVVKIFHLSTSQNVCTPKRNKEALLVANQ